MKSAAKTPSSYHTLFILSVSESKRSDVSTDHGNRMRTLETLSSLSSTLVTEEN